MGDTVADLAPTDDAEGTAAELGGTIVRAAATLKPFFPLLGADHLRNLAGEGQEHGKEVLGHGDSVDAFGGGEQDVAVPEGRSLDVVCAGTGKLDPAQFWSAGRHHLGNLPAIEHLGAADRLA